MAEHTNTVEMLIKSDNGVNTWSLRNSLATTQHHKKKYRPDEREKFLHGRVGDVDWERLHLDDIIATERPCIGEGRNTNRHKQSHTHDHQARVRPRCPPRRAHRIRQPRPRIAHDEHARSHIPSHSPPQQRRRRLVTLAAHRLPRPRMDPVRRDSAPGRVRRTATGRP